MKKIIFALTLFIISLQVFAQVDPVSLRKMYLYRKDEYGDIKNRRKGIMNGNQIRTIFKNDGEVGDWPNQPSGEWPRGTGHSYLDGVAVLIAAEVQTPTRTFHSLESNYRENVDEDPSDARIKWTLEPLPGYHAPSNEKPAINVDPKSWPKRWPEALDIDSNWNGYWYGYFGRGVMNSDFETFFVMDDSKDKEFTRPPFGYYPITSDSNRGGIGIRVEVRGFQWSHVLAEDNVFWHYDIVNISDRTYDNTCFGFYTDCGVGGTNDSEDDMANFDTLYNLAYAYDYDKMGLPDRWVTGYYGYAYLESPGNALDGIDNDHDGMIDERRDDNLDNDHDWNSYVDINGNGKWDMEAGEPLNDDVGRDGVGPFDPQYKGSDAGEGDGQMTHGEPNFDETDKDESDQIGLNAVSIYRLGQSGTGGGWPKDDESMWLKMSTHNFDTSIQKANISMVFASGPFPLKQALRERFSMALVFGNDLIDLLDNKQTVQQIYNANYNFSKPPLKPTLWAVPGDKQVFLYWDKVAEESRDAYLGYQNNDMTQGYKKDFEGYLVYRSQEAEFNDIQVITDSRGQARYWKPIAQYDLRDSISGPDPIGINGARMWRGSETGLAHSYIDKDVKNGVTYYYAVASYDMGDPVKKMLQPTECSKNILIDYAGNVEFFDINCAIVVPNAPAAGYVAPEIKGDLKHVATVDTGKAGTGTGSFGVTILNPDSLKSGDVFKIVFHSGTNDTVYKNTVKGYDVIRMSGVNTDTLVRGADTSNIGRGKLSPPFAGMTVSVINDTLHFIDTLCGWKVGKSNLNFQVTKDPNSIAQYWPSDYEIQFAGTIADTTFLGKKIPVPFKVMNVQTGKYVKLGLNDVDKSGTFSLGDEIQILEFVGTAQTISNAKIVANVSYGLPLFGATPVEPAAGDRYFVKTAKPFRNGDYFTFSTLPITQNSALAKQRLNDIGVVPNPYIGVAAWEKRNLNYSGRGERKIEFIHLPAKCTIRIYTIAGSLVKTLKKDTPMSDGSLTWNLITEDGMDVAYGIYVYHVEAPGIGEHIGKFAIIK